MIISPQERIERAEKVLEMLKKEKMPVAEIKSVEQYVEKLKALHTEGKLASVRVNSMCNQIGR